MLKSGLQLDSGGLLGRGLRASPLERCCLEMGEVREKTCDSMLSVLSVCKVKLFHLLSKN